MDHLKSKFIAQETVGIVCLYFKYGEKNQTLLNLMGSILQQLVRRRGTLNDKIKAMHDSHTADKIQPSLSMYLSHIQGQMETLQRVYIVADALDECLDDTRFKFLDAMNELPAKANIFLTSRDDIHVKPRLRREIVELPIRASDEDLKRYVAGHLLSEKINPGRLGHHLQNQPSLEEDIIRNVTEKANGMYVFELGCH